MVILFFANSPLQISSSQFNFPITKSIFRITNSTYLHSVKTTGNLCSPMVYRFCVESRVTPPIIWKLLRNLLAAIFPESSGSQPFYVRRTVYPHSPVRWTQVPLLRLPCFKCVLNLFETGYYLTINDDVGCSFFYTIELSVFRSLLGFHTTTSSGRSLIIHSSITIQFIYIYIQSVVSTIYLLHLDYFNCLSTVSTSLLTCQLVFTHSQAQHCSGVLVFSVYRLIFHI